MLKNFLRFKYLRILKKYSTNKIPALGIILIFLISSLSTAYPQNSNTNGNEGKAIVWDVLLNFDEPGSAYDYTVFGEAPDANDGPPADAYDTIKPPAPMPSYIRAWFNDNLPYPYNALLKDYREYPGMAKTWNLSVQWVPSDSVSPTTITISWNPTEINTTEYVSIILYSSGGTPLRDMLLYNSYSFVCPAFIPLAFTIICIANQPPNIPCNPFPSNGSSGVLKNADLGWSCSDPDGDPLTCDLYFGTSSSPPKVASNISGTTYSPSMTYGTMYYWRVVAWDNHGANRNSPLWHFQTNYLPNQPGNPSPTNNSIVVSINADLSWTCSDPDGDPLTYDVFFGTSSSPPKVVSNQTGTTYDPGTLSYGTIYYWKIIAWDLNSGPRTSPIWNFKTNSLPNQPSNPSPANSSTGVSVNADLNWTGGDPDAGDTVTYDVYFGTSSSPPLVSHNQSSFNYDPGNLAYYTMYYWKVVAWDNHGASTVGPRWQFRTAIQINRPPNAPSNPSPADKATQIPVNSDLNWTGGDPDSGDYVTYDVYFDTVNPPLTKIKSNTSGTSCILEDLNYSQKYYWKVIAWDNHQNTNASPVWSFTTKLDTSGPSLAITCPKRAYFYMNILMGMIQWKFPIFITTFVFGPITVTATASDSQSGMNRVEFYLDDELQLTDFEAPYEWPWVERGLIFPYQLTVKAFDNLENPSTLSLRVWKIL